MPSVNILLIDDEQNVLSSLKRLLRNEDYTVLTADNGQAGLDILSDQEVAVIICDQKMPGMTGAQTLKKAIDISPDTVRITLTAYTDQESFLQTVNDGQISQLILKPWDDILIKKTIDKAIYQNQLTKKNYELQEMVNAKNKELEVINSSLETRVHDRTLQLEKSTKILQINIKQMISLLAKIIGLHSGQYFGHSQRVAQLSQQIAIALELPEELINKIEAAANLHDLGILLFPDKLLDKNEREMTNNELVIYKKHPKNGADLVNQITMFADIAQMIEEHHEAYDGSGYGKGLRENDICLGARIIAVADLYDQEIHPFGNKIISTKAKACKALQSESGKKLDPDIVTTFLNKVQDNVTDLTDTDVELPLLFLRPEMELSANVMSSSGAILVKSGTLITKGLISQLSQNSDIDPVSSRFFLTRESVLKATGQTEHAEEINPIDKNFHIDEDVDESGDNYPMIMAVDDEQSVLNALKRELRGKYTLVTATDPTDALELIKKNNFVAVLSDFNMPVVKGDEFIRLVKMVKPNLPCIILTGQATRKNVERLIRAGDLSRIITKPWNKKELLATLNAVIVS